MKILQFEDVNDLMTLDEFMKLSDRCNGSVVPGKKMQDRIKREQFQSDVETGKFDGKVDAAARNYGVTRRTIYGWLKEISFATKNPNKKSNQGAYHVN
jgi:hypothetical protein